MIKYLGIDWGEKRIGLALADSENKISTPFKTVSSPSAVLEIIAQEGINFLVIGNPRKMSGEKTDNPDFLRFIKFIKNNINSDEVKIVLVDERLSSVQADSVMNKKINKDRDSLSAMIILQSYLDQK